MKPSKNNKELILSLIKDDLINSKLVNGLNELGLDASKYFINSSNTVFQLMGFQNHESEEEIFQYYLELTAKAKHIDISESTEPLNDLCEEIYTELSSKIPKHQK
jgi:hypothetical protein